MRFVGVQNVKTSLHEVLRSFVKVRRPKIAGAEARNGRGKRMSVCDKENGSPSYECAKEASQVTSILKPHNLLSFSPPPLQSSKKLGKVSFKNTPERHCPTCFEGEGSLQWSEIRKLDEEENWTERTQVVTKEVHQLYLQVARAIVDEIINSIPDTSESVKDMSSGPTAPVDEGVGTPEEEVDLSQEPGVVRRPHNEDPKDRPMSLLEFLGNEKMVEMSEGADLDTELMEKMEKLQIYAKSPQKRAGESGTETNGHSSPVSSAVSSSDAGTAEAEDEKPQKALPPKPWLQKKKVKKQNKDPFVVNFPQLEEKPEEHSQAAEDLEGTVSDVKTVENTLEDQVFQGNEEGKPQSPQNEGPSAEEEQTLEEAEDGMGFSDEDFKPADEEFSLELDYLERCGNNAMDSKESLLARQSLYVKFDPLVKARTSEVSADAPKKQAHPSFGEDLLLMSTPPPAHQPESIAARLAAKRKLSTDSKATQAAANKTNQRGVDSLLEFSPSQNAAADSRANEQPPEQDFRAAQKPAIDANEGDLVKPLLYNKDDVEAAVKRERELLLKQSQQEREFHEMETHELTKKNNEHSLENRKLRKENTELKQLMKEYEKTLKDMIEKQREEESQQDGSMTALVKERDQLQVDLNAMDSSFSELHRRYEKLKGLVENFKTNEELLKKAAKDFQEKQKRSEERYQSLKKHAEEKIESANIEIARVRKANDSEILVMKAALKREQARNASLEQNLQQKINENTELTAICDELISRAGGK